ncbi:hypothetical protein WOLCODRAFT_161441 [Wolfiporia cocos MD-104 SS10]|uniref:Uncharacterized protein n=1 Tax=Wolfiporia cocos (strain MD-104) TaxID=742152 RepID=A0A2H3JKK6_WOLCO|nr:hypothetical protein WOLCODRAFT_161441 [Wolfiporia cocos MD-104 SS10]
MHPSPRYTDEQRYCAPGPSNYMAYHIRQPFVGQQQQAWPQAPDSYLFGGAQSSSTDLLSSMARWSLGPPDFLLPYQYHGGIIEPHDHPSPDAAFSPSLSETSSIHSWESDPSPAPEFTHVVCNAPLVAPVPLPYHSPTFMQFDLPDDDEDLSHPPYTARPHKRKREDDTGADELHALPAKRRSVPSLEHPRSQHAYTHHRAARQYSAMRDGPLRGFPAPGMKQVRLR